MIQSAIEILPVGMFPSLLVCVNVNMLWVCVRGTHHKGKATVSWSGGDGALSEHNPTLNGHRLHAEKVWQLLFMWRLKRTSIVFQWEII